MGVMERMLLRKTDIKNLFEIIEFTYVQESDEIGVKGSTRVDTVVFTGNILECQAYLALLKEGWFAKLR